MCFKYCDAFLNLFKAIDDRDGDVRKLDKSHKDQLVDECPVQALRGSVPLYLRTNMSFN